MFWRFGGYANISTLDSILDKSDVTLEDLLEESDLIQELKQQNSKLVEFLREESVLKKLLDYVVAEKLPDRVTVSEKNESQKSEEDRPAGLSFFGRARSRSTAGKRDEVETEQEKKDALRKKYAYMACEVLSSEVWSITEAVMSEVDNLKAFWQYMHRPAPLDPLQAGYFTKVNETLLDKKTEEMLAFFKSLDGIIPAMLQHVDCPMVMDLLLKIISLEKHEGGVGIVDWLQAQDLIPSLLKYLSPEHASATQTSAGDFLKAIITISANATTQDQSVIGPNELTRQLVSESCVKTLINDMLRGGNALTVGVGIVIEVIRKNNSDYDLEGQTGPEPKTSDPIYLGTLLRQFANHLPDFMTLIRSSSAARPDLKAAFGGKIEPLGFDRFKTCELMAELLHCSNMSLLNEQGAEADIRKRDLLREKLKSEGKLAASHVSADVAQDQSLDEFGSSVDSHGFHHAERPSEDDMDHGHDERWRAQHHPSIDEDGFEKVNIPSTDDLPDEVTFDDFNEKIEQTETPAIAIASNSEATSDKDVSGIEIPRPLSPTKKLPVQKLATEEASQSADSPTSAGVTQQIESLSVDGDDAVMTEFGEEYTEKNHDNELERELAAQLAAKPAPLFASKTSPSTSASTHTEDEDTAEASQSVATLHAADSSTQAVHSAYATEVDGAPVVGDLLKIQFVEHQVVPTILDFFFRFPWNNFLHNVVYDVVQQVFNGTLERGYNRTLAFKLFMPAIVGEGQGKQDLGLSSLKDITDRVLDGQQASDLSQKTKGMRLGYMGHLTLIAEEVCKFGNRQPSELIDPIVFERIARTEWVDYVDGTLTETRERDNAVLGGVRPEHAISRPLGMGLGGFSSNASNALASAGIAPQDSLAMSEGTVGQSFETASNTMLGGFSDGDDDDEMDYERNGERRGVTRFSASEAFSEDEQDPLEDETSNVSSSTIPPPLTVAPSRARQQLAKRLAQRKKEANASANASEDGHHVEPPPSSRQPEADSGILTGSVGPGLNQDIVGGFMPLRRGSASRFSDLFVNDDSSGSDEDAPFDEDDAGRDLTLSRGDHDYEDLTPLATGYGHGTRSERRPQTTQAKERQPLDDEDDEDGELGTAFDRNLVLGSGGSYMSSSADVEDDHDDDSSDDEPMEIRPRRIS